MKERTKTLAKRTPLCKDAADMAIPNQRGTPPRGSIGIPACVLNVFSAGVIACATLFTAHAQVTQFDASRADAFTLSGNTVQEWHSVKPGAALSPLHGSSNGWGTVTRLASYGVKGTVSFTNNAGGAVASPLSFGEAGRLGGDAVALPVATIFAVVKCATPVSLTTLIDAPVDVRLTAKPAVPPSFKFSEEQLGHTATYFINGAETADFAPSSAYQLVEVTFGNPLELSDIFIGGSVPSPSWKRNWRGEIAELLFFPTPPSPEERNSVRHYAAVKWGAAVPYAHDFDIASRLRGLGIATEIFSTRIIVR